MAFSEFGNKWKSDDQASKSVLNKFKATIIDDSYSNDGRVSWSIVLEKQHAFIEFPTALDLNIFS